MAESIAAAGFNPPSAVSSADQPFQTLVNSVGAVGKTLEGVSTWQIVLTILVVAVTYDQCTSDSPFIVQND